ncbi:hypothetical protein QR680_009697 [Steinernema hermaphroditum]|uniref:Uncharacterized protein n=1 Tax=Steinernema hermaphroditum TaxID=289476 RepID=A0AA39INT5_9BILA|nr:hypothetical protein QR680_009697 [Steinernema hermaphroditum]
MEIEAWSVRRRSMTNLGTFLDVDNTSRVSRRITRTLGANVSASPVKEGSYEHLRGVSRSVSPETKEVSTFTHTPV